MAEEFTFANVHAPCTASRAMCRRRSRSGAKVIVGRDPRFLGETFCAMAAEILSSYGITPLVIAEPAPTPAISYAVIQSKADGAINFTASHNPPEYNGIKFSTPDGAPALPEVTQASSAKSRPIDANPQTLRRASKGRARNRSTRDRMYLSRLREIVDLDVIKKAGMKIAFDPMWGAARGYSDAFLREAGVTVATVHDTATCSSEGTPPSPTITCSKTCARRCAKPARRIGIATDGDADRFGIVDEDGTFLQPNYIIALLFDYLVESRGWKNGVGKSVATTNLINALAEKHKIELYETPVGFKYIGELIKQDKILIGGEESAGLSIRKHVPEKDGVLAGLLCCEMVARRGQVAGATIRRSICQSWFLLSVKGELPLDAGSESRSSLRSYGAIRASSMASKVAQAVRTDGLKLVLADGSWVCYRLSGTEPVVRVYSEARSQGRPRKVERGSESMDLRLGPPSECASFHVRRKACAR